MRILMVPHAYWPNVGGVERVVQQLARFLCEEGHNVGVLTNRCPSTPSHEVADGIPIWRLPFISRGRASSVRFWAYEPLNRRRIAQIVRAFQPDVVHLHVTSTNASYAQFAARAANCPLVITTHGSPERQLNAAGIEQEARLCQSAMDMTHCSRSALEQFRCKHPRLEAIGHVIYNGVAVRDFAQTQNLTLQIPYVVYVGRLDLKKGLDVLLRAWRIAGQIGAKLVMIGDGPDRGILESLTAKLQINAVEWIGPQPYERIIAWLKGAAAFVLPSLGEGFPMSVLEAMAAGCPIVATRVGGIPEQIEDGIHGLLVPPEDPEALAAALRRVLSEPKLARSLGDQAATRAATQFDWSHIARQYVGVYSGQSGID